MINTPDHDLLISINVKQEQTIDDIKDLKTNVAARVSKLEQDKVDKAETARLMKETEKIGDHEGRIRRLEYGGYIAIGALIILQFLLRFYVK